ncbi:FAD-dependent oxidoreductase [bacterium]|nr:FAD-dependent oxidoreductase [bacterium]
MPETTFPTQARVIVIGGGIIGCSVAYHLAEMGWKDVILLERDQLTSGTTWHAAGLMTTFGSMSETSIGMRRYSRELYQRLEKETGQSTGYKEVGFIEIASDRDRLEEFRRVAAFNRYCGIDAEEISASEVKKLFPYAEVKDVLAGFYVRESGRINPVDVTMALAKGAKQKGVTILQNTPVEEVLISNDVVSGVKTAKGDITAEFVVNCTGMWARQLGERSGVTIPNQAAEHYYLITDEIPGIPRDLPILEDPSCHGYYREETGGLMIGLFEPECASWNLSQIPNDFSFGDIPPDWERMTPFLEKAMSRVPVSLETGIRKFFCGPESFTPDLGPIVGESPEVGNYFVAAGLNSVGIITGGGLGRVVAHWIVNGHPDVDVTCSLNVDRFHKYQANQEYRRQRALESLGLVYKCHYPTRTPQTARGIKRSPFHDRLAKAGAYFKDVSGWESPDWYSPSGPVTSEPTLTWGRPDWFAQWEEEHRACREGVIAMDMTFMSKFLVQGNDAGETLNYISANEVNGKAGLITYTQWLNHQGTLEGDVTVIKVKENQFIVVATDTMHRHVETWLRKNTPRSAHATITDVTSAYGQLNIQGPRSRELLQMLTTTDLSNEAFPFRTAREIDIGLARALCVRITYLGELGYELNIPAEQAAYVYDRILEVGAPLGLRHAGLKALSSLRMEKAYRDYGHDIDNLDSPYDVGLSFAVRLKKSGDFIGKDACIKRKAEIPLKNQLLQFLLLDSEPLMFHGEIIYSNDIPCGYIRAASYGHTLGGAVGLGMVEAKVPVTEEYIHDTDWKIEIAGKKYPAQASLAPMYDPKMLRIKA